MFYNISNHPSNKWDDKQIAAASKLSEIGCEEFTKEGEIIDIPFPNIDPNISSGTLWDGVFNVFFKCQKIKESNTDKYQGEITDLSGNRLGEDIYMIQGEFTFVSMLIMYIEKWASGAKIVFACSERNVTEVDGKKIVKFNFSQFREKPKVIPAKGTIGT